MKGEKSEISENEKSEICSCAFGRSAKRTKVGEGKWRKTADEPIFCWSSLFSWRAKRWSKVAFDWKTICRYLQWMLGYSSAFKLPAVWRQSAAKLFVSNLYNLRKEICKGQPVQGNTVQFVESKPSGEIRTGQTVQNVFDFLDSFFRWSRLMAVKSVPSVGFPVRRPRLFYGVDLVSTESNTNKILNFKTQC